MKSLSRPDVRRTLGTWIGGRLVTPGLDAAGRSVLMP